MTRLSTFAALVLLSLLLGHELDAVAQAEWRLLPGLSLLSDDAGRQVFVALHLPLFAALVWALFLSSATIQRRSRFGLALFMMVHVGLHATLEVPGISSFPEALSRLFIIGAGLVGADLLAVEWWRTRKAVA
jgi:hypothetical protein